MSNQAPLDHALHNEKVCKCVDEGGFNDWVVTTAFYSAIHFVEHEIFPIEDLDGSVKHENFDDYCSDRKGGKHKLRSDLVYRHLISVSGEYDWLKNTSWTARYNKYQVSDKVKEKAKDYLQSIKGVCT